MKSLNSVLALLIGAALVTAGTGCKKTVKSPTLIPGIRTPLIDPGTSASKPVLPGANTNPGLTSPNDPSLTGGKLPTDPNANNVTTPIDPANAGIQNTRPNMDNFNEDTAVLSAETVYFDLDRATVKQSERPKLDRVATYMKNEPTVSLRVEGNCDERGTEDYNRSLGERRALSPREYLVNLGVAPDRITTVTYGEDKPADQGHDEGAWARNRRADFVVLRPKTNIQ